MNTQSNETNHLLQKNSNSYIKDKNKLNKSTLPSDDLIPKKVRKSLNNNNDGS